MIADADTTINMWKKFNSEYRALFPKDWEIRLYALAYFRAEVIPDMGKPLCFVLGLGHDRAFYEQAAKYFKEQTALAQKAPDKPQVEKGGSECQGRVDSGLESKLDV